MDAQEFFDRLMEAVRPAAARAYLAERHEWYDRTYGAPGDIEARAYLSGLQALDARDAFAGILEERIISDLNRHLDGLTPEQRMFAQALQQSYLRLTALPREFVQRRAEVTAEAVGAWREAKINNNFALFAPHLERVLDVARRQAVHWGGKEGNPDSMYTALLQGYDPGATAEGYRRVIEQVLTWLPDFIQRVILQQGVEVGEGPPDARFSGWSQQDQMKACRALASAFGFDFARGGLDYTEHPFCSTVGPKDVRLTMHHQPDSILRALAATAHETGHGLLEQYKPELLHWGMPFGFVYSLANHESQSRLWENHVFRSREFWKFFVRWIEGHHPSDELVERCYRLLHCVKPSLIRIHADEVTYPLHIAIRVKLEMALVSGELDVADLPRRWNDLYETLLGVRPSSDTEGVLQDIHWSSGAFGYFGTYLMGSMAAAQQFAAFARYNPQWQEVFALGKYELLLNWLRLNVYATALTGSCNDTLGRATGFTFTPSFWENHIRSTYGQPDSDIVRTGTGTTVTG